jgi:uncharacterized protein YegP (UPF0339 family)
MSKTYQVMQNANGQHTVQFLAENGSIVVLVCADKASAEQMAAHLDAMVMRAEVGEVAF